MSQISFDEPIVMASISPKHDTYPLLLVPNSIAYLMCDVFDRVERFDHDLVLATVSSIREGRLKEPPLPDSARHGWRATGDNAREKGRSVRDELLARVDAVHGS